MLANFKDIVLWKSIFGVSIFPTSIVIAVAWKDKKKMHLHFFVGEQGISSPH